MHWPALGTVIPYQAWTYPASVDTRLGLLGTASSGAAMNNNSGCDSGREQNRLGVGPRDPRLRSAASACGTRLLSPGSVATLSEKSGAPYPSRASSHSWMASTITVESVTS
jgi:hypothetical protein